MSDLVSVIGVEISRVDDPEEDGIQDPRHDQIFGTNIQNRIAPQ